jgi:hypothetical protein
MPSCLRFKISLYSSCRKEYIQRFGVAAEICKITVESNIAAKYCGQIYSHAKG